MNFYVMLQVPNEISSMDRVRFTEEQVKEHALWEVTDTPWVVHRYNSSMYNPLSKWKANLMSSDVFFSLAIHLYEQGKVSSFVFDCEVDPDDPGEDEMNRQRWLLLKGSDLSLQQIQKGMDYLAYLKEEGIGLESFKWLVSVEGRYNEVTVNRASAITYLNQYIKEETILQMYEEMASFLTQTSVTIERVSLQTHQKVPHPLRHQQIVVQRLFELSGDTVKRELGLSDEEWEWIQQDTLQHTIGKDGMMYEHEAKHLLSKLTSKGEKKE